ncbi:hypothetical protein HK405_015842 [Cladochytrium tenue]|nr:hypothetical protein HK405_015842 [Cladochytrium tenue]
MAATNPVAAVAVAAGLAWWATSVVGAVWRAAAGGAPLTPVLQDPWALSALADYVACVPLCASLVYVQTQRALSGGGGWLAAAELTPSTIATAAVVAAVASACLGTPVALFAAAASVVAAAASGGGGLVQALLVGGGGGAIGGGGSRSRLLPGGFPGGTHGATAAASAVIPVPAWQRAVWWATATDLVVFTALTLRAAVLEPASVGWGVICNEPWAWATFVDSFGGVLVGLVVVGLRERGSWWRVAGWWAALLLLGNGASCAYVLLACWGGDAEERRHEGEDEVALAGLLFADEAVEVPWKALDGASSAWQRI